MAATTWLVEFAATNGAGYAVESTTVTTMKDSIFSVAQANKMQQVINS